MKRTKHLWRFVLFAFLLNALLPFFAVYGSMPNAATVKNSLFGNRILICSGDGFRWITRDELAKHKPPAEGRHYECALCFFSAHGLKNLALFAGVLLAYALRIQLAESIVTALATGRSNRLHFRQSRAPPAFSF